MSEPQLPAGVTLQESADGFVVSTPWWGLLTISLGLTVGMLDLALVCLGITTPPLGCVGCLVAVPLNWILAAWTLNTTDVALSVDGLAVRHGPVPWPGNVRIPLDRIADVKAAPIRHVRPKNQGGGTTTTWNLVVVSPEGTELILMRQVRPGFAAVISREVRKTLGLDPDAG